MSSKNHNFFSRQKKQTEMLVVTENTGELRQCAAQQVVEPKLLLSITNAGTGSRLKKKWA